MNVILDANMLMAVEEFNINLFEEIKRVIGKKHELIIPESILEEIKEIKKTGKGENKRAASVAIELAKKCKTIKTENKGDDSIIEAAKKLNSVVATNDSELIKRLKNNNIPVIFLRQQSHLKMN